MDHNSISFFSSLLFCWLPYSDNTSVPTKLGLTIKKHGFISFEPLSSKSRDQNTPLIHFSKYYTTLIYKQIYSLNCSKRVRRLVLKQLSYQITYSNLVRRRANLKIDIKTNYKTPKEGGINADSETGPQINIQKKLKLNCKHLSC